MRDMWFLHPDHGHMLRRVDSDGWAVVVTSLVQNNADVEADRALWLAYKHRLRVNAGCGALAVDMHRMSDRNPAFVRISKRAVPAWIRKDFEDAAE